jgi:hypothetical protein
MGAKSNLLHHSSDKPASDNAFHYIWLARCHLPASAEDSHSAAYAGAGWAAVQLAISEYANIAAVSPGIVRWSDEYYAVQESKIVLKRMIDFP